MDKSVTVSVQISNTRVKFSILLPQPKYVLWVSLFSKTNKTLKNLDGCERWPLFISLGCKNYVTVSITPHAIPMGILYWQLLMKKNIPQDFYHQAMFSMELELEIFNLEIST